MSHIRVRNGIFFDSSVLVAMLSVRHLDPEYTSVLMLVLTTDAHVPLYRGWWN